MNQTRTIGFIGKCTFGAGPRAVTLQPNQVMQFPAANAAEILRHKEACDLTPDDTLNPYGVHVPQSVLSNFGQIDPKQQAQEYLMKRALQKQAKGLSLDVSGVIA